MKNKKNTLKTNQSKFYITKKQREALNLMEDDVTDEILLSGSAGSAKTIITLFYAVKMAIRYEGFICGIVRKFITESMVTIKSSLDEVLKLQGIPTTIYTHDKTTNEITFENGSKFLLISGNMTKNDKSSKLARLGGVQLSMAIVDECSTISKQFVDILSTRIRWLPPSMDGVKYRFKLILITNPDISSWVYSEWILKEEQGILPDYRKMVHSTVLDNPHLSQSYKDRLDRLPKAERDRLYLGKWVSQSLDELIPLDHLNKMFTPVDYSTYPVTHISVDVAHNGANADNTVIVVWSNFFVVDLIYHKDKNLVENANLIKGLVAKHVISMSSVYVDSDGIGKGLVDLLKGCYPIVNITTPIGKEHYRNLKAQLYYKFRENVAEIKLSAINISSDVQEQIKQEFSAIDAIIIGDDKWDITPKKKVIEKLGGSSPDFSDALAYGMIRHFKSRATGIYHLI